MLIGWLRGYGPSNLEVVFGLVALGVLIAAIYWYLSRRWQGELRIIQSALDQAQRRGDHLRQELEKAPRQRSMDEAQRRTALEKAESPDDPVRIRELQDHLQRVIAHEIVKPLDFISSECEQMAGGLRQDQIVLRQRINGVRAKAYDTVRRARNILELADLERDSTHRTPVNLQKLLQEVLKELLPYADARGVELRTELVSLEPIFVSRPLVFQMFSNIVHNAVKYTPKDMDKVVDVALYLDSEEAPQAVVDVRDRGGGIETKRQESIFEVNVRGDGLVEPGSGLGLPLAHKIARLHGGDVVLVKSTSEGSLFRIILPYDERTDQPSPGVVSEGATS
jgi:signal transduction histidine kinase